MRTERPSTGCAGGLRARGLPTRTRSTSYRRRNRTCCENLGLVRARTPMYVDPAWDATAGTPRRASAPDHDAVAGAAQRAALRREAPPELAPDLPRRRRPQLDLSRRRPSTLGARAGDAARPRPSLTSSLAPD